MYQPDETIRLEVRVENETVWLTQQQMAELFLTTKQNISLHVNNIFREDELEEISVVKESLTTAKDGKRYRAKFYNLDVIISVGYRRSTTFQTPCVITRQVQGFLHTNLLRSLLPLGDDGGEHGDDEDAEDDGQRP